MIRWEYAIRTSGVWDDELGNFEETVGDILAEMGAEGWELITIYDERQPSQEVHLIFKRQFTHS